MYEIGRKVFVMYSQWQQELEALYSSAASDVYKEQGWDVELGTGYVVHGTLCTTNGKS